MHYKTIVKDSRISNLHSPMSPCSSAAFIRGISVYYKNTILGITYIHDFYVFICTCIPFTLYMKFIDVFWRNTP